MQDEIPIPQVAYSTYWLRLTLLSDTTFGRGDGVAGEVDAEVQHDEYGLPYVGGKTLKGLLAAECAEILFSLAVSSVRVAGDSSMDDWRRAASRLFGRPGSTYADVSLLHVGSAQLPAALRQAIAQDFDRAEASLRAEPKGQAKIGTTLGRMRRANLSALTAERRQTAMNVTGAPQKDSLRSMRVVLRQSVFEGQLQFFDVMTEHEQMLLAACVHSLKRVGTGRNRGRGRVCAQIFAQTEAKNNLSDTWFEAFKRTLIGSK